jgi:lycopene cyclase domain-containing protein
MSARPRPDRERRLGFHPAAPHNPTSVALTFTSHCTTNAHAPHPAIAAEIPATMDATVARLLFLAAADALAIADGIWTIDPEQTLNWYLGGILHFEEFLFFLITNILVVFGMTLFLAAESQIRLAQVKDRLVQWQVANEKWQVRE